MKRRTHQDDRIFGVENFYNLAEVPFSDLFEGIDYVWEALARRNAYIRDRMSANASRFRKRGAHLEGDVYLGERTIIEPGAFIKGPTIIGDDCEIRHGAYIRGNVIVGNKSVIGHATEVIRSIILNNVRADHFAYIGDSILGNNCHLGAGVILANVKMRRNASAVGIRTDGKLYDTGMRKLGGILGDDTEIGCNSTANPGTILGKGVAAYPGLILCGYHSSGSVIGSSDQKETPFTRLIVEAHGQPTMERISCPNCGEQISSLGRVRELIVYCKEFFGQCNCGQKYYVRLSSSGGATLSFPDRQVETYLQIPERACSALDHLSH